MNISDLSPEEQRMLMAAMKAQRPQMAAGMSSPYMSKNIEQPTDGQLASANRDYTGREAALAQQMRGGMEGLMSEGAQGIKAGNVYAGPTWTAQLASAMRKGLGGYQMAKANEGREALQGERDETALNKGIADKYAMNMEEEQQGRENFQNEQDFEEKKKNNDRTYALAQAVARETERDNRATLEAESGGFQGTGVEQQMLNIMNNPDIPMDDWRKIQAMQRLQRAQTEIGPNGSRIVTPGYSFDPETGAPIPGGAKPEIRPGRQTEAGITAQSQLSVLEAFNTPEADYAPTMLEAGAKTLTPDFISRQWFLSDDYKKARPKQIGWSSTINKVINGGKASDADMEYILEAYWPVQGDEKPAIELKRDMRRVAQKAVSDGIDIRSLGLPSGAPKETPEDRRQALSDEKEALYQQFPHLRPK